MDTAMNQVRPLNGDFHTGHMTSSIIMYDVITAHKNIYITSRSFRLALLRSSISIRRQTRWGWHPPYPHPNPQVRSRMAKHEVRARVKITHYDTQAGS